MLLSETDWLSDSPLDEDYLIGPSTEQCWVEIQPFLLQRGYRLRPRYNPEWTPSWFQVPTDRESPHPREFEDSLFSVESGPFELWCILMDSQGPTMLDGVRVRDGQRVFFKKVKTNTDEIGIAMYLSSKEDPRNHTVPIFDVIMLPGTDDEALLVMPLLLKFHLLPFRFLGEFCEFALQMLEGLEFMHEHNIAHRDACYHNLMMDATKVVPRGHHFCVWNTHDGVDKKKFEWNTRWSVRPVQYYIIDFAQDKSVPELSKAVPYNPFMVDVYHFGNVIKRCLKQYTGLKSFSRLADAMTRREAHKRPSMSESVKMCKAIIGNLKPQDLQSRVWRTKPEIGTAISCLDKVAVMLLDRNPIR